MNPQDFKSIKINLCHESINNLSFDIETRDNISQFRNMLAQSTALTIYENYHFEHNGKTVSQYQEIGQIFSSDVRLIVVMDPFTEKSSRYHLRRVKKILTNPTIWAVMNCKDSQEQNNFTNKQSIPKIELDHLLDQPLTSPLIYQKDTKKYPQFVSQMNFSGFNPPPYYRKLSGDFFYLHVCTLENVDYHITANPQGYFINKSSGNHFLPAPYPNKPIFSSLLDLLNYISPKFKEIFNETIKNIKVTDFDKMMISIHDFEPQSYWLTKNSQEIHQWCNDGTIQNSLKQVDPNSIKDWNQLFQMQCVLPSDTLFERLNKQKLKYKLYQEFIEFAKQGTINIIQGKILPLKNHKKNHLFIHGSLLYSITNQTPYSYSRKNHDSATSGKLANVELNNLARVDQLPLNDLHYAHMVIVKYRGFKVIVQSIIPGALNSENQIEIDEQFENIVRKLCKLMHISDDIQVIDNNGTVKRIIGNPQLKGIVGNDHRKYLINLMKLSPRDYNFLGPDNENCILRQQLIDIYRQKQKCEIPINTVFGTSQSSSLQLSEKIKYEQIKLKSMAKYAKEIMVPFCINNLLNSLRKYLSDTKGVVYVIHKFGLSSRYLGYICQEVVKQGHKHLKIVLERVILVKTLKNIIKMAMSQSDIITSKAIIVRIFNCLFGRDELRKTLEEDENQQRCQYNDESNIKKKKKKHNKEKEIQKDDTLLEFSLPQKVNKYLTIKPSELWEKIKKIALLRYFHKFPENQSDLQGFSDKFMFNKMATLRDLCLNLGVVLARKQYLSNNWRCFQSEDILQFRAICKHIPIQCKDLIEIIQQGDRMVIKCQVQEAIESYNKAMQYIISNFGGLHEKLAIVHKKISNIYFRIGEIDTALLFAHHSCEIFETIYGIDHIETIENYTLLGFYHYSKKNFDMAEHYLLKSIHLYMYSYGQCYPELVISYLNLSTIYESQKKYADAIMSTVTALNLAIQVFGPTHIHVAICHSALAALHYEIPDIQQCIKHQSKAVDTLKNNLFEDDIRVKQSISILEYYQNLQQSKKIKQVHEKQQKKIAQLYTGMSLFKMPQPTQKQKEQFLRMHKTGKRKFLY